MVCEYVNVLYMCLFWIFFYIVYVVYIVFEIIDVLENIDFIIYKNVYLFKWDICICIYIYINNEIFLIYIINLLLIGWILYIGSKKKNIIFYNCL